MMRPADIQPVPPHRLREGLRFVLAGRSHSSTVAARLEQFEALCSLPGRTHYLRWATRGRRPVGAAIALGNPGRWALLLHSPLSASGVESAGVTESVRQVAQLALADGWAFVQAVIDSAGGAEATMLVSAGLDPLAELELMRLDLPLESPDAPASDPALRWRPFDAADRHELETVLLDSYEQSLDCPRLVGLRSAADIIAGHQASGTFTPETWWLVEVDDRPAGVCFVSDAVSAPEAMVVYLGVAPSFRGRGLGRAMIRHAAQATYQRGRNALTLAVDRRNTFARNVYLDEGFVVTQRRWVHARTSREA